MPTEKDDERPLIPVVPFEERQMRKSFTAYAVQDHDGKILPSTVFETQQGAMTNWLVAVAHILIIMDTPEERIIELFDRHAKVHGASLVQVNISPVKKVR